MAVKNLLRRIFTKEKKVIICGLDSAGKSTMVSFLQNGTFMEHTPTMGKELSTMEVQGIRINLMDMGGQKDFRDLWIGEANNAELEVNVVIEKLGLSHHVIRLPALDYADMPVLYSAASALIFPSLFEGRGIPVLEAMACGCPVACSDIPPVRDSAEDGVLYFNPNDAGSICDSIWRFQADDALRNELSRKGIERLREYREENVVRSLHLAYQTACGK